MAAATLNLNVVEKRMLTAGEAAAYCGLAKKHFEILCQVMPVVIGGRFALYDRLDLDRWIDLEKTGGAQTSQADILKRLA